jgi:hypothetical protein
MAAFISRNAAATEQGAAGGEGEEVPTGKGSVFLKVCNTGFRVAA